MYKYFLDNYKDKSKDELLGIMASQQVQHKHAVKAAAKLLEEKFNHTVTLKARRKERLYTEPYFRTFSRRELFSGLASSILFVALSTILVYLSNVEFVEDNIAILGGICFLIAVILNHIFYRKEHNRSNRYIGRVVQTSILTTFVIAFSLTITVFVRDLDVDVYGSEWFYLILGIAMIAFLLEFIISLMKWLVRLIRWQI